ncbi:unnamed protein product, partial [Phaeothamnion confervicola]
AADRTAESEVSARDAASEQRLPASRQEGRPRPRLFLYRSSRSMNAVGSAAKASEVYSADGGRGSGVVGNANADENAGRRTAPYYTDLVRATHGACAEIDDVDVDGGGCFVAAVGSGGGYVHMALFGPPGGHRTSDSFRGQRAQSGGLAAGFPPGLPAISGGEASAPTVDAAAPATAAAAAPAMVVRAAAPIRWASAATDWKGRGGAAPVAPTQKRDGAGAPHGKPPGGAAAIRAAAAVTRRSLPFATGNVRN